MDGNPVISILRGLGLVEQPQANGGQPAVRPEDVYPEPQGMNWLERMYWRNHLPNVPQAHLGVRG